MRSPDQVINVAKPTADARGRDMMVNDGNAIGAVTTHKDSIVGAFYRLNAQPNWRVLGASEGWAEEFQQAVESRFNLLSDSPNCWLDAAGMNTLTGLVRLAVGGFVYTGEVLSTAEWLRSARRPISTAIQMVSPDRLSNPDGKCDDRFLRRGIRRDKYGRPLSYFIRKGHPFENYDDLSQQWAEVPAEKPWGRKQVIHIVEQLMPDQSRGVADMVAVLKQMRMTKHFQEITLQNAVINASFAAAIESELPPDAVFQALGGGQESWIDKVGQYMNALNEYIGAANNIKLDGAKIPHLFPGTKLNMTPMGTPGGVGTGFEESLHRHIAAGLGLSYEEYSRDYSKTSYASVRASMGATWRFMQSRKKTVADRFATGIYMLVLEEEINAGNVPLPKGKTAAHFYEPLMKEAYCACSWIGASRGQIDELKETQAAILRIKAGLSTYEAEAAKLGADWREIFEQRAREEGIIKAKGLAFSLDAQQSGKNDAKNTLSNDNANGGSSGDTTQDQNQ
ncbi:portal protein [Burkholderia phage vB_BceS_AH2]|uniref:Portal protein n=1 Tax=Burkholderia phage vB_BceS_AH2 TaxID=1133022 RepID=I6NLJ4_9CAUD|nr:portal protein [Burkholderia phage vB_BceS_AH2]AEY69575.1 portal protein [Burkholderia phage vB_BceS_AH2]